MIALKYRIGEEVKIYIFQKFRAKRKEIEGREDSQVVASDGDLLGDMSFSEFDDLYNKLGSSEDSVYSLQENKEWICEDFESEDSYGIRTDNDLVENT